MNRALRNPQAADYLAKLLGMLGSNHDGERAAAAVKAHEFVRRLGLSWADVIYSPCPPSWWEMANDSHKHHHLLNERERGFLNNISRLRRPPTDRQLAWLEAMHVRLHEREVAA